MLDYNMKKHQDELKSSLSSKMRTNNKTRKTVAFNSDSPMTMNDNLSNKKEKLAGNSLIPTLIKLGKIQSVSTC